MANGNYVNTVCFVMKLHSVLWLHTHTFVAKSAHRLFLDRYKKLKQSHIKDIYELRQNEASSCYISKGNNKNKPYKLVDSQQICSPHNRPEKKALPKTRKSLLNRLRLDL